MSWNKKIVQFLFSCFIIANLTTAFGFTTTFEVYPEKQYTELVTSKRGLTFQDIAFDIVQKELFSSYTPQITCETGWFNRFQITNQKNVLQLIVQEQTTIELKPILLKIVLNDKIQATTYSI